MGRQINSCALGHPSLVHGVWQRQTDGSALCGGKTAITLVILTAWRGLTTTPTYRAPEASGTCARRLTKCEQTNQVSGGPGLAAFMVNHKVCWYRTMSIYDNLDVPRGVNRFRYAQVVCKMGICCCLSFFGNQSFVIRMFAQLSLTLKGSLYHARQHRRPKIARLSFDYRFWISHNESYWRDAE
jgi:hypothetical protein